MPRSIRELLAKERQIHPPTSATEVRQQFVVLMANFNEHGLRSPSKIDEAIRAHRVSDHVLLEKWITVRAAMEALGIAVPERTKRTRKQSPKQPPIQPINQSHASGSSLLGLRCPRDRRGRDRTRVYCGLCRHGR